MQNSRSTEGGAIQIGSRLPSQAIESKYFLDTSDNTVYEKINGSWRAIYSLPSSLPGGRYLLGSTTPSPLLGNDSDVYLNLSNGDLYTKVNGSWLLVGNLKENIYTIDGQLTGNRTVNQASNTLEFVNAASFSVSNPSGSNLRVDNTGSSISKTVGPNSYFHRAGQSSVSGASAGTISNLFTANASVASTESTNSGTAVSEKITLNSSEPSPVGGLAGTTRISSNNVVLDKVPSVNNLATDLLVRDAATGVVQSRNVGSIPTIYNADGQLNSDRIVDQDNQSLLFSNIESFQAGDDTNFALVLNSDLDGTGETGAKIVRQDGVETYFHRVGIAPGGVPETTSGVLSGSIGTSNVFGATLGGARIESDNAMMGVQERVLVNSNEPSPLVGGMFGTTRINSNNIILEKPLAQDDTLTQLLVRDSTGVVEYRDVSSIPTIYTADDQLISDRTVDQNGQTLSFSNTVDFSVSNLSDPDVAGLQISANYSGAGESGFQLVKDQSGDKYLVSGVESGDGGNPETFAGTLGNSISTNNLLSTNLDRTKLSSENTVSSISEQITLNANAPSPLGLPALDGVTEITSNNVVLATQPATNNTIDELLVRDTVTGVVQVRDANTFPNIYTADGTLTGPRNADLGTQQLQFSNLGASGSFLVGDTADVALQIAGTLPGTGASGAKLSKTLSGDEYFYQVSENPTPETLSGVSAASVNNVFGANLDGARIDSTNGIETEQILLNANDLGPLPGGLGSTRITSNNVILTNTPTTDNTITNILVRDPSDGTVQIRDSSSLDNIYTADGTLTGDRTVDLDAAHYLRISNLGAGGSFRVGELTDVAIVADSNLFGTGNSGASLFKQTGGVNYEHSLIDTGSPAAVTRSVVSPTEFNSFTATQTLSAMESVVPGTIERVTVNATAPSPIALGTPGVTSIQTNNLLLTKPLPTATSGMDFMLRDSVTGVVHQAAASAVPNIYTADGTLTGDRNVDLDATHSLTFSNLGTGLAGGSFQVGDPNEIALVLSNDFGSSGNPGVGLVNQVAGDDYFFSAGNFGTPETLAGVSSIASNIGNVFGATLSGTRIESQVASITEQILLNGGEISPDSGSGGLVGTTRISSNNIILENIPLPANPATDLLLLRNTNGVINSLSVSDVPNIYNSDGTINEDRVVTLGPLGNLQIGDPTATAFIMDTNFFASGNPGVGLVNQVAGNDYFYSAGDFGTPETICGVNSTALGINNILGANLDGIRLESQNPTPASTARLLLNADDTSGLPGGNGSAILTANNIVLQNALPAGNPLIDRVLVRGTDNVIHSVSPSSLPSANIYNSNGSITGNRTVNIGANNLSFTNIGALGSFNVGDSADRAISINTNLFGMGVNGAGLFRQSSPSIASSVIASSVSALRTTDSATTVNNSVMAGSTSSIIRSSVSLPSAITEQIILDATDSTAPGPLDGSTIIETNNLILTNPPGEDNTIQDVLVRDSVSGRVYTRSNLSSQNAFLMRGSSNITLSAPGTLTIPWDVPLHNVGFTVVGGDITFLIPGTYEINANIIAFTPAGSAEFNVTLAGVGGTLPTPTPSVLNWTMTGGNNADTVGFSSVITAVAGDVIRMTATYTGSGATLDLPSGGQAGNTVSTGTISIRRI